jgi:hypothetical protein
LGRAIRRSAEIQQHGWQRPTTTGSQRHEHRSARQRLGANEHRRYRESALTEPEYRGALGAAITLLPSRLVITGVAEGRYGSSSTVFAKLAAVLSVLLNVGSEAIDEAQIWATWDEPWRACLCT